MSTSFKSKRNEKFSNSSPSNDFVITNVIKNEADMLSISVIIYELLF